MCISARSSLGLFSTSLVGIYLLIKRDYAYDRWLALMCFFVALVQLGEFFIWTNLKNKKENAWATKFIYIAILLQPLSSILMASFLGDEFTLSPSLLQNLGIIYFVVIGFQILRVLISSHQNINSGPSTKAPHYLVWDFSFVKTPFIIKVMYFAAPLIFLSIIPHLYGLILMSLYYFIFMVSYLKYHSTKQWSSIWCLLGNIYPWIILIVGHKVLK